MTIPFADIDLISVKRYLLVWSDLLIVSKNGAAIRLRPLVHSDAEHAGELALDHESHLLKREGGSGRHVVAAIDHHDIRESESHIMVSPESAF